MLIFNSLYACPDYILYLYLTCIKFPFTELEVTS